MPRPTARSATAATRVGIGVLALFLAALAFPALGDATISSGERHVFVPVTPTRVLDTRTGKGGVPIARVGAGATLEFAIRGVAPVSGSASAVTLNLTVTAATAESDIRVFPGGTPAPATSTINFGAGQTVANGLSVKVGANGKVAIKNASGAVHVIADVTGYYENHDHDDRYDTKAQVDAKFARTGYVGTAQIADAAVANADLAANAVTGPKVANGSLGLADVATTMDVSLTLPGPVLLDPGECLLLGAVTVPGTAPPVGSLVLPALTSASLSESIQLLPIVVALGYGSVLPVTACNVKDDGNTRVFAAGSLPARLTVLD